MPNQLPVTVAPQKLLKVCFRLLQTQDSELEAIGHEYGLEKSELIRMFVAQGLQQFHVRKQLLNQKVETLHCQNSGCGKPTPKRKLHPVKIFEETFLFCDTCFFNGTYLSLIKQLL